MNLWDKKRDMRQRYDVTAQIYDMRYAEEQAAKIEAALQHVKVKAAMLLDVGCGTGISFDHVADEARMTVGIDLSKKSLFKARERSRDHTRIHLVQADADNMPLRNEVFDRVLAITLIQNMPNPTETLNEIKRVAKANASIVVTGLKKIFDRNTLEQLLKGAGLGIIVIEGENLKCHVAVCTKTRCA